METFAVSKSDDIDNVHDLVRYRLEQQIKGLHPDDLEVALIQNVIKLYEMGIITVGWDAYDIWVKMRDGSETPLDLLCPFSAEEKEMLEEESEEESEDKKE